MRRGLVALAVLLVLASTAVLVPAMAQSDGQTDGDLGLDDLEDNGQMSAAAPEGVRWLGQYGSAKLRHQPVGLGSSNWDSVSASTLVKRNDVQLRTVRLGSPDDTLHVHVVGWNRGTQEVQTANGTIEKTVATNVTERVVEVDLERGYDNASVDLPPSYGQKQQITMWVEEFPDAKWRFSHRSIATSRPINISTWGGFLSALWWKIGIWALPAMALGWSTARRHRQKAIVGPQLSLFQWAAMALVPLGLLASVAAFQGAVLATRVPALLGLLFGPLVYVLVLESGNDKLEKYLFRHQDLENAKSPRGETTVDSRYVDHTVKQGVRRHEDGEIVLIQSGLLPYFARLRGRLAVLDITEVETHKEGTGPFDLEIELDPEYDARDALIHDPPTISRLPITTSTQLPGVGNVSLPNLSVLIPLGLGGGLGWVVVDAWLGIPMVGLVGGLVIALPAIHRIEDGGAEAEPAPYHFTQADASLAKQTEQYDDAASLDEFKKVAWREKMKSSLRAREEVEQFGETVTERLNEVELGTTGPEREVTDGGD